MTKAIEIQHIRHKGEDRIRVDFPFQPDFIQRIKKIRGRRWSQSKKCWHLPYDQPSLDQLKHLFPEVPVVITGEKAMKISEALPSLTPVASSTKKRSEKHPMQDYLSKPLTSVNLLITPSKLYLQLAKQPEDLRFIRSLRYVRWNLQTYHWEITASEQCTERVQEGGSAGGYPKKSAPTYLMP